MIILVAAKFFKRSKLFLVFLDFQSPEKSSDLLKNSFDLLKNVIIAILIFDLLTTPIPYRYKEGVGNPTVRMLKVKKVQNSEIAIRTPKV
jgi:hypothetical protein